MTDLIHSLSKLPDCLALTPVNGNKAPYLTDWQKNPLNKTQIVAEIKAGKAKAVGVLCGTPSAGLLFLDHDGASCDGLIDKLSGGTELPKTVGVTSGRLGRYQLIYRVPEQYWGAIATKKIRTGSKGDDGKDEQLELRWTGCQSVVIGAHPTTDGYRYLPGQSFNTCEIAEAPMWMIEQMLVDSKPKRSRPKSKPSTNKDAIPLEACLSVKHRKLLASGASEGNRDDSGIALAKDLIGTANYLTSVSQAYDGDPYDFLSQYCDRCTPPLSSSDCDRLFKSAERSNPAPCLDGEKIDNCIKACSQKQKQSNKRSQQQKTTSQSDEFEGGAEGESDLETKQELTALQEFSDIAKPDILPQPLMDPLRNLAGRLNLPVEAYVGALLAVCSSQLRVDTRLELDPTTDFYVRPILWVGIVGETGAKKSPLLRAIISPLNILQQSAEEDYQNQLADYDEELQEWESASKKEKGKKPKPPSAREYYLSDFTIEALGEVVRTHVGYGFLINIEELARFFSSMDSYRNGRGGDRQHWLSFYDGGPFKSNRKTTGRVYAANTSISLVGGIQPAIVQNIMTADGSLEDGLWSRFTWVRIPIAASPGIQEGATFDLSSLLKNLYESLAGFEAKTYKLSYACKLLWNEWHHEIEQLILKEPSGIIRAAYPKAKERAARIALVTHVINAAMRRIEPTDFISEDTLRNAIQFTRWLMGQTRLLYAECGIADNPETAKILKFVHRFLGCGSIDARTVVQWHAKKNRPTSQGCRDFMAKVVQLGYARANNESSSSSKYRIDIIATPSQHANKNSKSISGNGVESVGTPANSAPTMPTKQVSSGENVGNVGNVGQTLAHMPTDSNPLTESDTEEMLACWHDIEKEQNFQPGGRCIIKNLLLSLKEYPRMPVDAQAGTHEIVAIDAKGVVTTLFAGRRYKLHSTWLWVQGGLTPALEISDLRLAEEVSQ